MSYTNPINQPNNKKRREPTRHALWDRSREQAQIILNEMTATYERQVNFILARCNDLCQAYKTEARETIEKFGRQFEADVEEIWTAAKADVAAAQETMARWQVEFEQNTEAIRLETQAQIEKAQAESVARIAEAEQVMAEALKIRAAAEARQGEVSRWMKQAELLATENTALIDELNAAVRLLTQAPPEPTPPPATLPPKKDTKKAGGKNKPLTHQKPKKRPNQRRQNDDD